MIDATERWEVSECTAKADANYVEFQIRKRGDDSLGAIIGFTAELPVHERELAEERANLLAAAPALLRACQIAMLAHDTAGAKHSMFDPGQSMMIREALRAAGYPVESKVAQ